MSSSFEPVKFEWIDLNNDLFTCSWPLLSKPLMDSIRRVGLLKPVTLVQKGERYVVASGLRRALAVKKLGQKQIQCRVLSGAAPKDAALFFMNLEENLSTRSFNFFEKVRLVKRIMKDLDLVDEGSRKSYFSMLGIKESALDQMLAMDALAPEIKDFLLKREGAERFARMFLSVSPSDGLCVKDAANDLNLTASQLKEVFDLGKEISQRDSIPLTDLIRSLLQGLEEESEDSKRKRSSFMSRIRKSRFPEYSEMKSAMEGLLSKINGQSNLTIQPPQSFESDVFSAAISFCNKDELIQGASKLLDFAKSDDFEQAMRLLES